MRVLSTAAYQNVEPEGACDGELDCPGGGLHGPQSSLLDDIDQLTGGRDRRFPGGHRRPRRERSPPLRESADLSPATRYVTPALTTGSHGLALTAAFFRIRPVTALRNQCSARQRRRGGRPRPRTEGAAASREGPLPRNRARCGLHCPDRGHVLRAVAAVVVHGEQIEQTVQNSGRARVNPSNAGSEQGSGVCRPGLEA